MRMFFDSTAESMLPKLKLGIAQTFGRPDINKRTAGWEREGAAGPHCCRNEFPFEREHFRAAYEINPQDSDYRTAVQARVGDKLPVPPAAGWTAIFTRRKAKITEARFIDLLLRDLNTFSISPLQPRKSPRKQG